MDIDEMKKHLKKVEARHLYDMRKVRERLSRDLLEAVVAHTSVFRANRRCGDGTPAYNETFNKLLLARDALLELDPKDTELRLLRAEHEAGKPLAAVADTTNRHGFGIADDVKSWAAAHLAVENLKKGEGSR